MPLNAASHAEDLAIQAGKPASVVVGRRGKRRRGWKGFYGSVHDIVSIMARCILQLMIDHSIVILAK